jgi:hypothetical protein
MGVYPWLTQAGRGQVCFQKGLERNFLEERPDDTIRGVESLTLRKAGGSVALRTVAEPNRAWPGKT